MGSVVVELVLRLLGLCGRVCSVTTVSSGNYFTLKIRDEEAVDQSLLYREILTAPQVFLFPQKAEQFAMGPVAVKFVPALSGHRRKIDCSANTVSSLSYLTLKSVVKIEAVGVSWLYRKILNH